MRLNYKTIFISEEALEIIQKLNARAEAVLALELKARDELHRFIGKLTGVKNPHVLGLDKNSRILMYEVWGTRRRITVARSIRNPSRKRAKR